MNIEQAVTKLKAEAKNNEVAREVFLMWSMRERARSQVTVHTLTQSMSEEGFTYTADQYRSFLKFLVSLDFGKIMLDKKGRVIGMNNITITLQSIGKAALGEAPKFHKVKKQNRFQAIPAKSNATQAKPFTRREVDRRLTLTVMFGDKAVNIQVPPGLSDQELSTIIRSVGSKDIGL